MMRIYYDLEDLKRYFLNILGLLFVFWGVVAIGNNLFLGKTFGIFWGCYPGLILTGVAILYRKGELLGSQLVILGLPLFFWDFDFLYRLFTGSSFLGVTDYFFVDKSFDLGKLISLQHLFTVPLAILCLSIIKVKNFDFWKIGLIQVSTLFVLSAFLTPPLENINCVFRNCSGIDPNVMFLGWVNYQILWFSFFFLMIFAANIILKGIDNITEIFREKE